jgi:hypothetical protein
MVFERNTKLEIYDRATNENGELFSELNPSLVGFRFEVAHLNHTKDRNYNNPDNGLLVTTLEHYVHHLLFLKSPLEIGLAKHQNDFAIEECYKRALFDANELKMDKSRFIYEIKNASKLWVAKLGLVRRIKEG